MDAIAQRQQSERDALAKRHAIEVEKFRLWVEAEIVNACHSAPPDPNQPIRTAGRLAHHASACEYFLKQRYGSDIFIDRSKSSAPPDTEFVRALLAQKNGMLQRQQYESDALRAAQLLEWVEESGTEYQDPSTFPRVPVVELSLEEMAPKPEDL